MSPPQGSPRYLRPYQVNVHQDDSPLEDAAPDIVAKTDNLIYKLAETSDRTSATSKEHAAAGSHGGLSRKFRQYPQSYHDQLSEHDDDGEDNEKDDGPDLSTPYRGGDGRDAPVGYEFAVRSYQHEDRRGGGAASVTSGALAASSSEEAARRAEVNAHWMAEEVRRTTGREDSTARVGHDSSASSYLGEGVQTCVRSMLSCLNVEGPLVGYSAAPDVGLHAQPSTSGSPFVTSSIYDGFSSSRGAGASSENTGLLGSFMTR